MRYLHNPSLKVRSLKYLGLLQLALYTWQVSEMLFLLMLKTLNSGKIICNTPYMFFYSSKKKLLAMDIKQAGPYKHTTKNQAATSDINQVSLQTIKF